MTKQKAIAKLERQVFIGLPELSEAVSIALAALREQQDIVRCKDCEYGDNCICIVCESGNTVVCQKQHKHVEKNHFCSYGQRRLESNQH